MTEWFSNLELFSKVYWGIALIASLVFIFMIIFTFIGAETDGLDTDTDTEIESDTGIGFQFITFKNLVGFFTIFGWSGIACIDSDLSKPLTVIISLVCGLIMMSVMAAMFYYMQKLNDSGTLEFKNAINAVGEVYLTIGAKRTTIGKAHVRIQGALRELEALTDSETDLKSGSVIIVKDVTENGILIVEQLNK
jgi:glucan phosphoethanolaminetransferase (alkaline phosphatase superfamily)